MTKQQLEAIRMRYCDLSLTSLNPPTVDQLQFDVAALIAEIENLAELNAFAYVCTICKADVGCSCDRFTLEDRSALVHKERIQIFI
jgi:hypothetical protein